MWITEASCHSPKHIDGSTCFECLVKVGKSRHWTQQSPAAWWGSRDWDTFLHRGKVAVLHCVCTAGTEIQSCLVLFHRCHSERKEWLLLSRDTVAFRYVSCLNISYYMWAVNQSQPLPWVLSVPVHGVVIKILLTFQSRALSFLSDQVFWDLSDFTICRAYGRKRGSRNTAQDGA